MEYFLIEEKKSSVKLPLPYKKIDKKEIKDGSRVPEAFVVVGNSNDFFEEVCRNIRHLGSPKIYLKPVIFIVDGRLSPRIAAMADAVFSSNALDEDALRFELKKIDRINDAIRKINPTEDEREDDLFLRVLRFIFTRDKRVEPVRDRTSFFGITYPAIESFFSKEDYALFSTLEFLEENGSIEGDFFEKVHLCNKCHCSFLNFMEVCPNCGSANLLEENLIHHFPCAYVGPESDFMKGGQLVCPKCNKKLKGLGVDYDKPAVIHKCNNCGFVTQEPDVKTICFNCEKESPPEDLIVQTIKVYTLTSVGENFAIYGFESPLLKALREQLNILPYNSFLTLIQLEIERSKRYGVESSVVAFQIVNLNDIYAKLGKKTDRLLREIGALIKVATRKSDVLTILNEGMVLLLLPHTPLKGADVVRSRLVSEIDKLIEENVGIKPYIESSMSEISKKDIKQPDKLVEELLKNLKQVEHKQE